MKKISGNPFIATLFISSFYLFWPQWELWTGMFLFAWGNNYTMKF